MAQSIRYNSITNVRQEQFHHFINEFNYLYQQTKTVSLPPSLSLLHLLYPTVLFPTMSFYPQDKGDKRAGSQQIKNKVWQIKRWKQKKRKKQPPPLKIAHLINSSFKKESGVQRIMSMVCQHTYRHTYIPCSCAQETHQVSVEQTHTVLTGQTRYTHTTRGKWKQETVGHRRWYMSVDRFIISPLPPDTHARTHTHTNTQAHTNTGWSALPPNTTTP